MRNIILIAEEGDIIGEKKLITQYLNGRLQNGQWQMIDGTIWDILVTGVGALNILQTLRNLPKDTRLLNIGYAGSTNFDIGSAVEVIEARLNHPCVTYPEPTLMLQPISSHCLRHPKNTQQAICYSNTDFVLHSEYHDCVFDMELAYIAGLGFKHLSALKIVSDNLNLHTYRQVATENNKA